MDTVEPILIEYIGIQNGFDLIKLKYYIKDEKGIEHKRGIILQVIPQNLQIIQEGATFPFLIVKDT
jgi:hypothetical protein